MLDANAELNCGTTEFGPRMLEGHKKTEETEGKGVWGDVNPAWSGVRGEQIAIKNGSYVLQRHTRW